MTDPARGYRIFPYHCRGTRYSNPSVIGVDGSRPAAPQQVAGPRRYAMKTRLAIALAIGLGPLALAVGAADWPQWRGPQRDGISQETGLLPEWPADGPKLLWRVEDIGSGYSTPAVV